MSAISASETPIQLLIYTDEDTPRFRYITDFIFKDILGVQPGITTKQQELDSFSGPKIAYGAQNPGTQIFLKSHGLLSQKTIEDQEIEIARWEGEKVFFKVIGESALPFDPFSAAFFLVTRYEEYLPFSPDVYERFPAAQSLAFRENFLHEPLVDIWAMWIQRLIEEKFPQFNFPGRQFKFVTSIDVDNAYEYLEKGVMRTMGAYARGILSMNTADLKERTRTILGREPDAYDTFEHQLEIQKEFGLESIYFFLVADYGLNDKNVPITSPRFQRLIKHVGDYATIGVHPSYNSNFEPEKVRIEADRLQKVLHRPIRKSRQHFLKVHFPDTYRNLIEMGIAEDYTMGYASELGFRASTCTPFRFYDLQLEEESNLTVHPFCAMEVVLKFYKQVPPEEAMDHIRPIIDAVKKVNGTYMSLWHNDSLSETKHWKGWKSLYRKMVEYAVS